MSDRLCTKVHHLHFSIAEMGWKRYRDEHFLGVTVDRIKVSKQAEAAFLNRIL